MLLSFSTPVEVTSKELEKTSKEKEGTSKTTSKTKTSKIKTSKIKADSLKADTPKSNTPTNTNDEWGWDNWADDFIVQAAGKVSNLLETVEGQLGIPDPAKMAKAVSAEEQIAISATTNQQQKQQSPQKPKEQHKTLAGESPQPHVQQPTASTSIIFYSLILFPQCYNITILIILS